MGLDIFNVSVGILLFAVYGATLVLCVMFAFFLEIYHKIEEKISSNIIYAPKVTVFDLEIDWVDAWLKRHHRIVGYILIIVSLIDIQVPWVCVQLLSAI
jgi:allantoicase